MSTEFLLRNFGNDDAVSAKEYRKYVMAGLDAKSPFDCVVDGNLLGVEPFGDHVRDVNGDMSNLSEVSIAGRVVGQ